MILFLLSHTSTFHCALPPTIPLSFIHSFFTTVPESSDTLSWYIVCWLWVPWFIKDSFFINPELSQIFNWFIHHHDHRKVYQTQKYGSYLSNKVFTTMNDIPKISEKWVKCKYGKIESLDIVPGTWFDKRANVRISKFFLHDILYMVGFVEMRRIQWYYFHYIKYVEKWPLRENTILEFWHYVNDVIFVKLQCPVKEFEILVPMVLVSCQSKQNPWKN